MARKKTALDKLTPEQRDEIRAISEDIRRRVMDPDYVSPYAEKKSEPKRAKKTSVKSGLLKKTRTATNRTGLGGGQPRYDYRQIADLWSQGVLTRDICKQVGCGMSTVRTALKTIRPEGYTGRSGPRKIDECQRGHDMTIHGKPIASGGRYCSMCKRDREREAWHRRKDRIKEASA